MIVSPYTSGTMGTGWRSTIEQYYKDLVRETIAAKWAEANVPPDYSRPRQDIDRILNRVVWLHPRAPRIDTDGNHATRVGYYLPRNLRLIDSCDFVISCIYPDYPSIDSAHEIGFAYARGKPVITVDLTHGLPDYAAWRAMSLVVLDDLQAVADFLLYQVQDEEFVLQPTLGDKIPA